MGGGRLNEFTISTPKQLSYLNFPFLDNKTFYKKVLYDIVVTENKKNSHAGFINRIKSIVNWSIILTNTCNPTQTLKLPHLTKFFILLVCFWVESK